MVVDASSRAHKHNAAIAKQLNVYGKKNCMLNVGTNTSDDEVYLCSWQGQQRGKGNLFVMLRSSYFACFL